MIGIDLGGRSIKAVRLEGEKIVLSEHQPRQPEGWLDQLDDILKHLEPEGEEPIGIGVAGLVDGGALIWAPHVDGIGINVQTELETRLGRRIVVDNDANCATWAESRLGQGRGVANLIGIMIGTGIGMGLIVGGRIYRGRALAGEAGHMAVVAEGGAGCPCGQRGCWETLVSGWRLAQMWGAGRPHPDASVIARAAAAGDRRARAILEETGRNLGLGLSNLIALLDPDLIVIGGGVTEGAGEALLAPARDEVAKRLEGGAHRQPTPIVAGRYGIWGGAVGAALLGTA